MTTGRNGWKATGIFGGTFDPIHFGHLRTAFECRERLQLAEVRFVPSPRPPHRVPPVASAEIRLRMLVAALSDQDGFVVDDREYARSGPSYTVDTLRSLRDELAVDTLCLVLGLDAFAGLAAWRDWEALTELAHIIVARRPGSALPTSGPVHDLLAARRAEKLDQLQNASHGRVFVLDVTQLDISATFLRASIAQGIEPAYLLPRSVQRIIEETGCYDR